MVFTDSIFPIFFGVCFALRWLLPGYGAQKNFLLIASMVFYGAWDWRFLFLMLGCISLDYLVGRALGATQSPAKRRAWLVFSLFGNLGVLGFFKYLGFFATSGASLLTLLGVHTAAPVFDIVLPVGISFFTFQSMSYVIDVYRGQLQPVRSFRDFALFVAFFPQLVAGPIVRASDFLPQLTREPRLSQVDFRRCLALYLVGYVKKACIADNIAGIIDPVFASPSAYHASDVLLAASGYSIQIYCDFSGYTDIAIATAGMLGFKLCRNFDAPYLSTNVREFWRRWHMSLSTWLRDYLYVSLGGGRGTRFQMYRNLLITMVLGGLWHGAKLTFVLWGLAHGLALVLHRALGGVVPWKRWLPWLPIAALGWACTLGWVVLLFTLFRCDSVATFSALCSRLSAWDDATLSGGLWLLIAALGVVHFALHRFRAQIVRVVTTMRAAGYAFLLGAGISLALFFTSVVTAPFIYFQF